MNLSKIHHIAIIVSDYEAAKDFYVNKLGFSVIRENYRPERKDWKLDLRVNEHTELEIFVEKNPPKVNTEFQKQKIEGSRKPQTAPRRIRGCVCSLCGPFYFVLFTAK